MKHTSLLFLCSALLLFFISSCSEKRECRQTFYPKGKLQEEYYVVPDREGRYVRDGSYTWWYENGKKKQQGFYRNGLQHGKGTTWYETGEKEMELNSKYGVLDDTCVLWYKTGNRHKEWIYRDGEAVKLTVWDESGNVAENMSVGK